MLWMRLAAVSSCWGVHSWWWSFQITGRSIIWIIVNPFAGAGRVDKLVKMSTRLLCPLGGFASPGRAACFGESVLHCLFRAVKLSRDSFLGQSLLV